MLSAARFFDDPRYLSTVVAEKVPAESAAHADGAARLAGCRPGALILDAGCGNGRHSMPLALAGFRMVAVDRSRFLLSAGRAAGGAKWPHFVRGSYAALPIQSSTFEAVLSLGTALGYLGDGGDRMALREFRRVLAPRGRLVIETLHRDALGVGLREREERPLPGGGTLCFERRLDRARGVMYEEQRLHDGSRADPPRAYELRVYGEDELRRMLEEAGFEVVGRHASLRGGGEPSPITPLVLVAQVRDR
ncbi:MAG TPA: methyltransferase domain-containing protein [Solirubrobacteraceae bacterium]|nr:methyltransferase domain-containing protein [Solirubrobacteraceae bacterium]